MLRLQIGSVMVKLGGAGVRGRLVQMRLGRLGIGGFRGLALRLALMGHGARLALPRPPLSRARLAGHVSIVHNEMVPFADSVNQAV